MRRREQRRRKGRSAIGFICTALIGVCSMLGVGQAAWNDTLQVKTTVSTGELGVEFVDENGYSQGSTLGFSFNDVEPGSSRTLSFRVRNYGTIPARWEPFSDGTGTDVIRVDLSGPGQTLDPGEVGQGEITITATNGAERERSYPIGIGLIFRQSP